MTKKIKNMEEAAKFLRENADRLFKLFQSGELSSKEFKRQAKGYSIRLAGRRDYSKYTPHMLREIRKKNGVGRPPSVLKARREAHEQAQQA